ncbi:hypothetical protein T492DRAFT_902038, partial [Pavlovales sp. CCMP2436]
MAAASLLYAMRLLALALLLSPAEARAGARGVVRARALAVRPRATPLASAVGVAGGAAEGVSFAEENVTPLSALSVRQLQAELRAEGVGTAGVFEREQLELLVARARTQRHERAGVAGRPSPGGEEG